jgi:ATP-dependent exoDNAse (exonuclease V) alpha subunit
MADYHCSAKPISRSTGRSATGAAAYRAGEQIVDARTGLIHDYRKKQGVVSAEIVAPVGAAEWATNRELLWNAAEAAEKRKDACVAREYVIALPCELDADQRRQLALDFARQMVERHGFAADVCIHAPSKDGDQRNHHAHILTTTRQVGPEGLSAKKCDIEQAGRKRKDDLTATRQLWEQVANQHLERAGRAERIDHRTLKDQGIEREPTKHLGPAATEYERRTGEPSRRRESWQEAAAEREAGQRRLEAAAAEAKGLAQQIETAGSWSASVAR